MPTPSPQQARSQHARQVATAAAGAAAVGRLVQAQRPWSEILGTLAQYQLAAATGAAQAIAQWAETEGPSTNLRRFAGVSSAGFPLSEPLVAAIDAVAPAPAEALPSAWWEDAVAAAEAAMRVAEGQIKDAARSAMQTELVSQPERQNYVRLLTPPSCKRCVVLAGRIYRDLEGFDRHPPTCDCIHIPVQDWEEAHDAGLVSSPRQAFEKGWIRDLSQKDAQAIADGADIAQVVNASQNMTTAEVFGRRVKATTAGTTKRAQWRKKNPTRLVRLRPESIYRIVEEQYGGDREQALRLLRLYGYLT